MPQPVIIDGVRTPIGKYGGALANVRSDDLAAHVLRALLNRNPLAAKAVNEVCVGSTNQAGEDNRNVGRMAALLADLPFEVTGSTTNRLCGSGMDALVNVCRGVMLEDYEVAIAGGVESMTRAPYVMAKNSQPFARHTPAIYDTSLGWRFPNPKMLSRFPLESMGETAENVAERYEISREAQDTFAFRSHRRASEAQSRGAFADEIVPVQAPFKKGTMHEVTEDESVRKDTSLEKLAALKPVFRKPGTVTAGNSSPLNDGAAALVVTSDAFAKRHGIEPLGRVLSWGIAGVDPSFMGIGPVPATRTALSRAGLSVDDIDLVELNEAFAAQALACIQELGLDEARVNINGGALALGHPIGCSGARIVVSLLHEMKRQGLRYGLAALCIGVGQGMALVVERTA